MAPSTIGLSGLAIGAGLLCALRAGYSFVNTPATGGSHLRASSAQLLQQVPLAAGSRAGFSAASSVVASLLIAAGAAAARRVGTSRRADGAEIAQATIPRPEDLLESPKFPLYMGSTGGYMSKATRERHAITWTSKEEQFFEMPIGGEAIMNAGENLCYFRKKEQCIALGKQLRKLKIENYKIYRIAKDGTVTFMHPADGVFPEKVNKGRIQVNGRPFTIGSNPKPSDLKWTKYHMKSYEADPLTTMFVKARLRAFMDIENLFALPNPNSWVATDAGKAAMATDSL